MADKTQSQPIMWANKYPVVSDKDFDELDREAAINEFRKGQPRQVAESAAYDKYRQAQHEKAATFHLKGLAIARASNDPKGVAEHGRQLYLHIQSMPDKANAAQKIKALADEDPTNNGTYKFKNHPADNLLSDVLNSKPPESSSQRLDKSEALDYFRKELVKSVQDLLKVWDPVPKRPGQGETGGYEYRPGSIQSGRPELKLGNLTEPKTLKTQHPSFGEWASKQPSNHPRISAIHSMGMYNYHDKSINKYRAYGIDPKDPSKVSNVTGSIDNLPDQEVRDYHNDLFNRYQLAISPTGQRFKQVANEIEGNIGTPIDPNNARGPLDPHPFLDKGHDTLPTPDPDINVHMWPAFQDNPAIYWAHIKDKGNVAFSPNSKDPGLPLKDEGHNLSLTNPNINQDIIARARKAVQAHHDRRWDQYQRTGSVESPAIRPIELE